MHYSPFISLKTLSEVVSVSFSKIPNITQIIISFTLMNLFYLPCCFLFNATIIQHTQNWPPPSSPPPPPPLPRPHDYFNTGTSNNGNSEGDHLTTLAVGVAAGASLLIALIVICVICVKKKKNRPNGQMQYYADHSHEHRDEMNPASPLMQKKGDMSSNLSDPRHLANLASPNYALGLNKSTFSYEELDAATNGFSQDNLLGRGGFGYVFKGVLPNGKVIAVKSLTYGSTQGEREFQAEVEIISRVHHRNLVSLVGYCIDGEQRMLVYEFVSNKTLDFHLHVNGGTTLNWPKRLGIAIGTGKGLEYLHEHCHPRIIHRDIKASNILLDESYEAMVADFGLARLTADSKSHVSTRVMGTIGYLAPEYASSGQLTEKSDVFSYGVMLLELITGRKVVHMGENLTDWARPTLIRVLGDNNYDDLVDPHLHKAYTHHEMARMITCASASISENAKRRPKMSQIVRVLEGDVSIEVLNEKPNEATVET